MISKNPRSQKKRFGNACFVYVLRCRDGSLYTGWTVDLTARLAAHRNGRGSRFVRSRLPVELRAFWLVPDAGAARSEEARFKAFTRAEKLRSIARGKVFSRDVREAPAVREPPLRRRRHPGGLMATKNVAPTVRARIVTPKGDIVFKFYPNEARLHSAAFIKLARAGFYDGLKFHRVEPGFVIQGGDPVGNGTGGPGYTLDAEFSNLSHTKGAVAMARSSSPNSAGSQFYICLGDARFLDKQYTVFGDVVEGQDVVDKIKKDDVMTKVTIEDAPAA